jgi:uncharacterized protein
MSRGLFTNLPVADLARSRAYFEALGFSFNPQFSDDTAACLVIVPDVACVMLLTHEKWRQFTTKPIADAKATSGVLIAVALDSRAQVEAVGDAALAHGGSPARPPEDLGFMFTRAIDDPDGHTWEFFHMDMAAFPGVADAVGVQ